MWPRKRIDIGWLDLLSAASNCLSLTHHSRAAQHAEQAWVQDDTALACLSVRSGLDILLQTLALPRGSEILVSAVNLGDMFRVLEHHGLVVIPVDVHRDDMSLRAESLPDLVTSKTRAILVAQLLGIRNDLAPVVEFAREHQLLVLEDCAQAFAGSQYRGHPDIDVSMFSFGPIKTATALGGGMLRVQDSDLLTKMRDVQAGFPPQPRRKFFRRILTYLLLKFVGIRAVFRLFFLSCRAFKIDFNSLLKSSVRNFSGGSLMDRLRQQPSVPLLKLMARRIRNYPDARIAARKKLGELITSGLPQTMSPGIKAERHCHWLTPILHPNPELLIHQLAAAGFDATADNSMETATMPNDRKRPSQNSNPLDSVVYLPLHPEMPQSEAQRMLRTIQGTLGE